MCDFLIKIDIIMALQKCLCLFEFGKIIYIPLVCSAPEYSIFYSPEVTFYTSRNWVFFLFPIISKIKVEVESAICFKPEKPTNCRDV